MRRTLLVLGLASLAACAPPVTTSPAVPPPVASPAPASPVARVPSAVEWSFHAKAAGEARRRKDWAARQTHLEALHAMAPHTANLLVSLAQNAMRRDDRAGAVAWLQPMRARG